MQLAEQILGDAQVAKEELLQYKADLEVYREKTRKEFSELISLVNSEEIANLKNNITILSITSQIRNKYEEGRRIMDAYWEDYRRLQRNHEFDLTEGYEECTASAIAIASKLKEPLANLTEANELLDETIKWKKRVEKAISEVRFEAEPFFIDEYMKDFGEKVKLQEKIDSLQEKIDSLAE
jgi:phage-related minor tail protein